MTGLALKEYKKEHEKETDIYTLCRMDLDSNAVDHNRNKCGW